VRVNSGRVKPEYRLKSGDRVGSADQDLRKKSATAKPAEFPVVHEDAALARGRQASGVAVHGGSGVSFGVIESLRARGRRPSSSSSRTGWTAIPRAC
jgi:23S rRNA pseudouridine955/2504/2580 synthase